MKNILKEKILNGNKVIGTFFELGSNTAVECLGISGLDFLIIDTEHGPFDVETAMDFIRCSELRKITPFVRVKDMTRPSVLKMLDVGAMGIVVPYIETVDQVKQLVSYGKYYPVGNRGFFYARSAGFGYDEFSKDINRYFDICNKETMLLPQCETRSCLEHIDEIVQVEGVDGIFIGPYDLSIGMGKPGKFEDKEFSEAVNKILRSCNRAKKFSFIYATNPYDAKNYLNMGFDGVAVNVDASIFINAFKKLKEDILGC